MAGLNTDLPIPLYVGKTAGSLAKRVGQHLRLSDERMLPQGEGGQAAPPRDFACSQQVASCGLA